MQYDLRNQLDKERLKVRLRHLMEKGSVVEVTEKSFRTHNQNNYLHLLLGVVAMETGNTIQDTKDWYFKRVINKELFCCTRVDKFGNSIQFLKSTKDLTKEEMSTAIDRLKRWGYENGIYLPDPCDEERLRDIEIELGRNKQWL